MWYFSSLTFGYFLLIFSFISSSYAADGKWSDSLGKGDFEYSIEVKKYRLYINCPTENGNASASSYVEFSDTGKELKSFDISVGGKRYEGPFEASSRVGANNFTALLDDLNKTDAVVSFKGGSVTLPKSNAASVLHSYGKKCFVCNLDDVPSQASSSKSNKSSTNEAKTDKAYNIGIYMGAIIIAKQRFGDDEIFKKYLNKFKLNVTNYEKFIVDPCKSKMTEACFNKLPDESKFYLDGVARARTELNSPKPVTIHNSNRIGADRSTLITTISGYCEQ